MFARSVPGKSTRTHKYFAVNGFLHVLTFLKTKSVGHEFLATIGGMETNAASDVNQSVSIQLAKSVKGFIYNK